LEGKQRGKAKKYKKKRKEKKTILKLNWEISCPVA
jgi:hypothetical protein